jgi:hypothetical protein
MPWGSPPPPRDAHADEDAADPVQAIQESGLSVRLSGQDPLAPSRSASLWADCGRRGALASLRVEGEAEGFPHTSDGPVQGSAWDRAKLPLDRISFFRICWRPGMTQEVESPWK